MRPPQRDEEEDVVYLCRACHDLYHRLMGQQVSPLPYKRDRQLDNALLWLEARPLGWDALPFYVKEGLEDDTVP